jgi:hypothetical protein
MGDPAFDEGMKAGQLNRGKRTNPYPQGTRSHKEWANGYEYALDTNGDEDFDPYH